MAPTVKQTRYYKSDEQLAQLRARIADGMNSAYKKEKVQAAMLETGLTRSQVTEFIRNEKEEKKKRGSRYKKKGTQKKTKYQAFLGRPCTDFNFNGCGKQLGNLTRAKAAKYRELKDTEVGQVWLEENLRKAEEENATTHLTAIQKHNRAVGCFNKVQQEIEVLNTLSYKAAMICYQPTRRPTVLGSEDAVHFFVNDTSLMNQFDKAMGPGKAVSIRAKHKRKILRQKVQTIFNQLYAKTYGMRTSSPMPYTAIEAGTVEVMLEGLPDGLSFQRPRHYKIHELKAIIQHRDSLKIADAPECTDVTEVSDPDIDSHPISSPQTTSRSGNGSAPEGADVQLTAHSDLDLEVVGSVQTLDIGADGQVDLGHRQAVTSSNIVSLDCDSLEDALRKALSRAQEAERRKKSDRENTSVAKKSTASADKTMKKRKTGTNVTSVQAAATKEKSTASADTTMNKRKRGTNAVPAQAAAEKEKSTASADATMNKRKRGTNAAPAQAAAGKENSAASSGTTQGKRKRGAPAEKVKATSFKQVSNKKKNASTALTEAGNVRDKEENHTGRRIEQLFEMVREKRKKTRDWYKGTIKEHANGMYVVEFEDNNSANKEVYTYSEDQFLTYRRKKNLVFL